MSGNAPPGRRTCSRPGRFRDGLGRVVSASQNTGGATVALTYDGMTSQVASDSSAPADAAANALEGGTGGGTTTTPEDAGWTIKGRMRAAGPGDDFGLPNQGRIRYVPPRGYNPASPLPRGGQGGYLDRFDNECVVGPSRTPGQPFEWDVQLSRTGRQRLGYLSRDGAHVNVSPLGEWTHF